MPFKAEIIEKYFNVRLSTGVKFPLFYVVKFIAFWSFGMMPNNPDQSLRHRNEPHMVLESSYWYPVLVFCLSSVSLVSHSLFGPPSPHQWNTADSFLWLTRVAYENYGRKVYGRCTCTVPYWMEAWILEFSRLVGISTSASFKPCDSGKPLSLYLRLWFRGWENRLSSLALWRLNQTVHAKYT